MALPTQIGSYRQHIDVLDRALANEVSGIEVELADHAKAVRFRQMCYNARKLYGKHTGDYDRWAAISISVNDNLVTLQHNANDIISIKCLDGVYEYNSALDTLDLARPGSELAKDMLNRPSPERIVPGHNRMPVVSRASRAREEIPMTADEVSPDDVPRQVIAKPAKDSYAAMGREVILPEGYDSAAPFAKPGEALFGDDS